MKDKRKENGYKPLSDKEYYERFQVEKNIKQVKNTKKDTIWIPKNPEMIEEAYKKAWECRNFEIDKTWVRSVYFAGFHSLIFIGYTTSLTSNVDTGHLDLYLVLLGILFSVAWFLVIIGSKAWQENWEKHIDYLENFISGPLYKTVFYTKSFVSHFFSVSKINIGISLIVCLVWIGILIDNYIISCNQIDLEVIIPIVITGIILVLLFILAKGKYKLNKNIDKEMEDHIKKHKGAFIDRYEHRRSNP